MTITAGAGDGRLIYCRYNLTEAEMAITRKQPMKTRNGVRARWANRAVHKFQRDSGLSKTEGLDIAITDLLCDLAHLCNKEGLEFERLLSQAMGHFIAERTV